MPIRAKHIRVGKLFLSEVYHEIKQIRKQLEHATLSQEHTRQIKEFDKMFNLEKHPKDFFKEFYKTRLMRLESMVIKDYHHTRKARYVKIFGLLRTLFLGILGGDPRTGFLTNRIAKYKRSNEVAGVFENFVKVARAVLSFKKKEIPKHILASANAYSTCEAKPKNLCLPPQCEYIHHTRRTRGYCRMKNRNARTRRKSRRPRY